MRRWLLLGFLVSVLLLPASIHIIKPMEGALEGLVTDDRGPVQEAVLEVRNEMTGDCRFTESDAVGYYRFEDLRGGRYSLWVRAAGHDSLWLFNLVIPRGHTVRQDLRMRITRDDSAEVRGH